MGSWLPTELDNHIIILYYFVVKSIFFNQVQLIKEERFDDRLTLLAQRSVFSGSPVIDSGLLHCSIATLIRLCLVIAYSGELEGGNRCYVFVHVNASILGDRLKKDATITKNTGHFGPGLVRPGRFGQILR